MTCWEKNFMTEKTFIDSQRQVTLLDNDSKSRMRAESRQEYFHFCKLSALEGILESKAIKFNNIENIYDANEYERKNVEPEFWGQVFVACLTQAPDSETLWDDFGDNGRGVRINFAFPSVFHIDVLDKKRLVRTFGADDKEYEELGFAASAVTFPSLTCNPNKFTQPIVDISLTDITYTNEPKASYIFIDRQKALNISSVSTEVPSFLWDEYETRVRGVLRCTHDVCISKISYLLVPINFKYVSLTFGKKVNREKCQHYIDKLDALKISEE